MADLLGAEESEAAIYVNLKQILPILILHPFIAISLREVVFSHSSPFPPY